MESQNSMTYVILLDSIAMAMESYITITITGLEIMASPKNGGFHYLHDGDAHYHSTPHWRMSLVCRVDSADHRVE